MSEPKCRECGSTLILDGTTYAPAVDKLTAELAAAKADLSRHRRALELALYYVEGDATYEGVKEKVSRILEGGE